MSTRFAIHKDEAPHLVGQQSEGGYSWLVFAWDHDEITFHRQSATKLRAMAQRLNEIADQWEPPTKEYPVIHIQEAHVNASMQSIGEPDEIDDTPDDNQPF